MAGRCHFSALWNIILSSSCESSVPKGRAPILSLKSRLRSLYNGSDNCWVRQPLTQGKITTLFIVRKCKALWRELHDKASQYPPVDLTAYQERIQGLSLLHTDCNNPILNHCEFRPIGISILHCRTGAPTCYWSVKNMLSLLNMSFYDSHREASPNRQKTVGRCF